MKTTAVKLILISLLVVVPLAYAARKEVRLTTYYPAPAGDYRRLTSTGSAADPDNTVVFQAVGRSGTGLVIQNDGIVRTNNGLIVHVCNGTQGTCPTNATAANGQVWFDTSVNP